MDGSRENLETKEKEIEINNNRTDLTSDDPLSLMIHHRDRDRDGDRDRGAAMGDEKMIGCHVLEGSSSQTSSPKAFGDDDQHHPPPPWMYMADFIAEPVLERLPLSDFIKFGAVCKHWRHLQQQHQQQHSSSSSRILALPWFLPSIPKEEDGALTCISLFEGSNSNTSRCYNLFRDNLEIIWTLSDWYGPYGTCSDWLILQWDDDVALFNPVTGVRLILPRLPRPLIRDIGEHVPSLSPPPLQVVFFVLRRYHTIFLFRCGRGDLAWFELHFSCELWDKTTVTANATTSNGQLYCLTSSWDLLVVSTSGDVPSIQMVEMDKTHLPAQTQHLFPTLVQANNDILLLLRTLGVRPQRFDLPVPTESFLVFKADLKRNKWVEVKTIGDQVLFVHSRNHASFPAPHGVKGNSIYFSVDLRGPGPWEVFDIDSGKKTKSVGPLGDPSRGYTMFMPNLC